MSKQPNTWCRVCGEKYHLCAHCEKIGSWKTICDTPEHYSIYLVIYDYQNGMSIKEAKNKLLALHVDKDVINGFIPSVKTLLSEILNYCESDENDSLETENIICDAKPKVSKKKAERAV